MPVPDGPQFRNYRPYKHGEGLTPSQSDQFLEDMVNDVVKNPHNYQDFMMMLDADKSVGFVVSTNERGEAGQYLFTPFGHSSLN